MKPIIPHQKKTHDTQLNKKEKILIFEKIGKTIIVFLAAPVLCFLGISSLFEWTYISQNVKETCEFVKHDFWFLCALLVSAGLLFFARKIISKLNSKKLFLALLSLYLIAGFYLLFNAEPILRADAKIIYENASAFNQGDFSSLATGGYLARYPHQLGLVTLERIFILFGPYIRLFFTLNLLLVMGINFFQWKIAEILSDGNALAVNYTIIFSFFFLPQLFFILFVYGLIPGFCCTIAAVYFMMRYFCKRKLWECILSVVFIALSCALRNNFMIAAIAMFLVYVLDFFRSQKKSSLILAVAVILCSVLLPKGINAWYRYESKMDFGEGTPKLLWVTMGLQDADPYLLGGWYNNYVAEVPQKYQYDYDLSKAQAKMDLQERLEYLKENPGEAATFFHNKIKSTWLDPLFQSIWTGSLPDCNQHMSAKMLSDLYSGKGGYLYITRFLNIILTLIYLLSLVYLIFAMAEKKIRCEALFAYLFFLGGFLFHLVWETKSQYVYPYVFLLIPMAAMSVERLSVKITVRSQKFRESN
ncbi:MAG: hypothetical protein J1F02_10830 [Lachnospiraceae bacterium]|nr:hypothetical protein [Lachnospiraceae bacterium]